MVKHNNVVPNAHFKKYWQKHVHTWFDQPGRKVSRRAHRTAKAKQLAPRPIHKLRPIVRCQTIKYNSKNRAGRGFTIDEVLQAGFRKREARTIGIVVDHRRRNKSEEAFQANVKRLKEYKAKLVIFPKNPKKAKKGDGTKEETKQAKQVLGEVLPIPHKPRNIKARKVTSAEKEAPVARTLRKALTDAKLWGAREKRAKDKEAGIGVAKGKGKKGKKGGGEAAPEEAEGAGGDDEAEE